MAMMQGKSRPVIISAMRTEIRGDNGESAANFARCRAMICANALESDFLAKLLKVCNWGTFASDHVEGLGHREVETPAIAGGALTLALKRTELLRWVEDMTECGPLASVDGRVVQTRPAAQDQLVWHNDLEDGRRRLAITVNLTEQAYEGGMFELRDVRNDKLLLQYRHAALGAALIFDVARGLEHRVLPLISGGPRRVYTGWFFKDGQS